MGSACKQRLRRKCHVFGTGCKGFEEPGRIASEYGQRRMREPGRQITCHATERDRRELCATLLALAVLVHRGNVIQTDHELATAAVPGNGELVDARTDA